jgi:RNA polymerase sigma factor for flagellar operon FliA
MIAKLPPGVDAENLEAAGVLGLVEAANTFDPRRGIQFTTYAYPRIRGAVLDELRRNSPLPQEMMQRCNLIRKAYRKLPHPVSVEALANETGLSQDQVLDCLAALRMTKMSSLDTNEWVDLNLDDGEEGPEQPLERQELREMLVKGIESLPERERLVVTLYHLEDLRLKEIGQILKLSESRVSRLLNAAMFRLQEYIRGRDK